MASFHGVLILSFKDNYLSTFHTITANPAITSKANRVGRVKACRVFVRSVHQKTIAVNDDLGGTAHKYG
jgi:hypothetical protein